MFAGSAFVRLRPAQALAQAREADASVRSGGSVRPLDGVFVAHKDMFYRRGEIAECGSRVLQGFVPDVTASVLERLDHAGAIDLGALHMAEFAFNATGQNEYLGDARNPWSAAHIAGGSSSGSAVAVAARLVDAAVGSDTGGSIRLPAAMCGVTAIKPSHGRVPIDGALPLAPSLDCVGFTARAVRDCARLLSVSAPDGTASDGTHDIERSLGSDVVVAVPDLPASVRIDAEIRVAMDEFAQVLASLGATILRTRCPDFEEANVVGQRILATEASIVHQRWLAEQPLAYGARTRARLLALTGNAPGPYREALIRRTALADEFFDEQFASGARALLLPVLAFEVPTAEQACEGADGRLQSWYGGLTYWTRPINVFGLPALSLPAGFTRNGLPVGLQLVGRPNGERDLFRIGHQYQSRTSWHLRVPPSL